MIKQKYFLYGILVLLLFISGCLEKETSNSVEPNLTEPKQEIPLPIKPNPEESKPIKLDLERFEEFDKSHFGFMHPEHIYYFMEKLNVHWARPHPGPFIWGDLEKEKDSYDWSKTDEYIKRSQAHDAAIMATIWPYARWDQKECHTKIQESKNIFRELGEYRGKPCDMEQYEKFLQKLIERYDGDGKDDMPNLKYPIKYWEIINEVELSDYPPIKTSFMPFFRGKSSEYLDILKTSYYSIKEADPDAKVLNAGIAGEVHGESVKPWEKILDQGGRDYIDIFNIHTDMNPGNLHLKSVREFMSKNNLNLPIWATEVQVGRNSGFDSHQNNFMAGATEEEVAQHVVKILVQAFNAGVTRFYYVGLETGLSMEQAALVDCRGDHFSGKKLLKKLSNYEIGPDECRIQKAYYAFKTLIEKIDYFTSVERLGEGRYKFIVKGEPVYVVWGRGRIPSEITGVVKVTDAFGNEEQKQVSQIRLGENPIFITS